MTDKELAKRLRAYRAERKRTERMVAKTQATHLEVRFGTPEEAAAALRALLLAELER